MVRSQPSLDAMENPAAKRRQQSLKFGYVLDPAEINVKVQCTIIFKRYYSIRGTDLTQKGSYSAEFL
jgi:hypothetical protein